MAIVVSLATAVDKSVFKNKTETIRPDFTARIDESPDDTMDAFCTATAVGVILLFYEVTVCNSSHKKRGVML